MYFLIFQICVSLLIFANAKYEDEEMIGHAVLGYRAGSVGNGSFVYFYVYHSGNIILTLSSGDGDADLYISESNMYPSYTLDSYDLHSATCGQDIIRVPPSFNSPISVGIYGHPAYETSGFLLEILTKGEDSFATIDEKAPEKKLASPTKRDIKENPEKSKWEKKVRSFSHRGGSFFSLFEIIQLLFL